jgi:hypothetical protein
VEKKPKQRTDADDIALADAIGTLADWEHEIRQELKSMGLSEKALQQTLKAMRRVHGGPEE